MFTTQIQLSAAIDNCAKTKRHEDRMKTDAAYRAEIEAAAAEYEAFCEKFGYPEQE